jgi:hypothetical protein
VFEGASASAGALFVLGEIYSMPGFMFEGQSEFSPSHQIGGGKDIHRVHRWRIDSLVGEGVADLKMYAKSIGLPSISMEVESGPGASMDYKFASKANFEDVTVVFYDVDGLYKKLEEMKSKVWTPDKGVGLANDYKAESVFILQTPEEEWLKFKLINSWVKALSHDNLTYESSDFKTVSVTLAYDWYVFESIPNQSPCNGGGGSTDSRGRVITDVNR